jgi:photosystem II stability/assembly factor-like uncharacterized protein
MPADDELDPLDSWLDRPVQLLPPPAGTFELITRRARRRKVRRTVVTVVSAAAVAAAVAIAVPAGLALHLGGSPSRGSMVAASSTATPTTGVRGTQTPSPGNTASRRATPPARGTSSGSASPGAAAPAPVPANFTPSSVTWDSATTGWVIGPAGTPGRCDNSDPYICTSIARTDDTGQTWQGLHAPDTSGPSGPDGVGGLRFLNGTYGWAFGPQLWATTDGGESWQRENTGGLAVTDLETVNGRAYALFGSCEAPTPTGIMDADCTAYTLMTTTAGSDAWTAVSGVPTGLSPGGGQTGSAVIELTGTAGYLVAPDGALYSGPVDGGAWRRVATLPCEPGPAANDGLPEQLMLAPAGYTSSGGTRLGIVCAQPVPPAGESIDVWMSVDGGATWARTGPSGVSGLGDPASLTATSAGALILATSNGIYTLPLGAAAWQAASLSDPSGKTYGFSYVGMTNALQGVALGGNPALHAIWLTTDGGQSWSVVPVTGS